MSRPTLNFLLALTLLASTLHAQTVTGVGEVQPGAKVRITAPGIVAGRYIGTVLSRSDDTLTLGSPNAAPFVIPTSRIATLEISHGKSRSAGAVRGMVWGLPIGLAMGALLAASVTDCAACSQNGESPGEAVVLSTLSGVIWGAGIGALVGRERWDAFDLPRHAALGIRSGGPALALRYEF